MEIAKATEALEDRRIHIEKISGLFPFQNGGIPVAYTAGLEFIARVASRPIARPCAHSIRPDPLSRFRTG